MNKKASWEYEMCMLIETNCIDSRPESIGKFRILWRLGKIFSWVTPSSCKCLLSVIILLSWPPPLKLNSTPQPCTPIPLLPCSIFPTVFIRFAHCFSSSVEYKAESKRVFFFCFVHFYILNAYNWSRSISRCSMHICWINVLMNKNLVKSIWFLFCWLGK